MSETQTAPTVDSRPPCTECGASMDGLHHKKTKCLTCAPSKPRKSRKQKPKADPKPTPVQAGSAGAVKIAVDALPPPDEVGEKHEYWVGVLDDCPIQNVTVGGITFPLFVGEASLTDKCEFVDGKGSLERGGLAFLTDDQMDFVTKAVSMKVMRTSGKGTPAYIPPLGRRKKAKKIMRKRASLVARDENYRARPGDVPLAAYLFMYRTSEMDFNSRNQEPEPMLQE